MSDYIYCDVWRRFGAYLYDYLLMLPIGLFFSIIPTIFIGILYWTLFESSKIQATPGKYLLNMKIINHDGTKISFLKSFSRLLLNMFMSIFIIPSIISIFCIAFTKQKKSIPDMIFNTRVVRR